jgi:hypothetical protein
MTVSSVDMASVYKSVRKGMSTLTDEIFTTVSMSAAVPLRTLCVFGFAVLPRRL